MLHPARIFYCICLAAVFASEASAAVFPSGASSAVSGSKLATTRLHKTNAGKTIEAFHPKSSFETFGLEGIDHSLSARDLFNLKDAALSVVQSRLNIGADKVAYRVGHANDVVQHAYVHQMINGIPVANAVANVAFNDANRLVSMGSSFVNPSVVPSTTPSISVTDAISKAEKELSGTYNKHPAKLEFVAQKDNSVALAHVVQVRDDAKRIWYEAYVDAHSGDIVHLVDFVAQALYRALPLVEQNVTQGFADIVDPQNLQASPFGWHSDGVVNTTDTSGNNVISFIGMMFQATTLESSDGLNFRYIQDATQDPTVQVNMDAARVNAFYVANSVHDISYLYGFTESAFNFQNNNFGKGGKGNDRVDISVQDASGIDNAFFSTPPDGQSGLMQMFLFDYTTPWRDGALENDVVAHENTHGITNRMTGGGTGSCLQTLESGGLGEGWSDAFAEWTEWTDGNITDFVLGGYLINSAGGIRHFPYSTNPMTNPLRYSSLQALNEVHDIGEVWANMLHNVYAALVATHGFSTTAKTDPSTTGGNTVWLHLFIDALPIQPCNPTFVNARDAWIQADANRYNGSNACTLWNVFASRGLGVNAANHQDDGTVPAGC